MGFSSLGLNQALTNALSDAGYLEPTPIQLAAIPAILNQQDIMAGAQTGTGKTAAFALPIIQQLSELNHSDLSSRAVKALVLTPTRELAQQVYKSFNKYAKHSGLFCAQVYGGVSINPQISCIEAGVDILVATPGRLLDLLYNDKLDLSQLQTLVFDEADRMLDMGFMDEIKRILKRIPEQRQTLLFSATFDEAIFKLSKSLLNEPLLIEVDERNTAATQVEQVVYNVDVDRKRELLSYVIGSKNWQQVLVFTRSKLAADDLAFEMCKDGLKTLAIHGDKSQGARDKALKQFKSGEIRVLVATDVAARGLDIQQLQYVVNYELPFIAEDYIHRIGRTGRAGSSGLAISLISHKEEYLLEAIEAVLDTRLLTQWYPGFEPDLEKQEQDQRRPNKKGGKRRAREKALGKKPFKRKR